MTDIVDDTFLSEGISRYAQALDTISAFESMLESRLCEIVRTYSFEHFTPTKMQPSSGTGEGGSGRWIWAAQPGKLKTKGSVYLELGIWWAEGKSAYYCDFCDERGKALPFVYNDDHSRVRFMRWGSSARLFLETSRDRHAAMKEDFDTIVRELALAFS